MQKPFVPFTRGPTRPKQIISLSFFRTGSQSLKEALTILGYKDVFHSSAMAHEPAKWIPLGAALDDNVPCLPTYTGRTWSREDWDAYFGPCEALTDVTPFAEPLLRAYPEARVILIHRDFDSWVDSFLKTLVLPSSGGLLARLSGNYLEPIAGICITGVAWKLYMAILGVCDIQKAQDRRIMREGYKRHYNSVRRMVPPGQLMELNLEDLAWQPLCEFLGKKIPDVPFPHVNESRVFRDAFARLHRIVLIHTLRRLILPALLVLAIIIIVTRSYFGSN